MSRFGQRLARFRAPNFLVLRIEASDGSHEYEVPLRKAYRNHPYELRELRELLDRIAAELDEMQTGEY